MLSSALVVQILLIIRRKETNHRFAVVLDIGLLGQKIVEFVFRGS